MIRGVVGVLVFVVGCGGDPFQTAADVVLEHEDLVDAAAAGDGDPSSVYLGPLDVAAAADVMLEHEDLVDAAAAGDVLEELHQVDAAAAADVVLEHEDLVDAAAAGDVLEELHQVDAAAAADAWRPPACCLARCGAQVGAAALPCSVGWSCGASSCEACAIGASCTWVTSGTTCQGSVAPCP